MAKLGMPSINISFIEAGIEAIQRSQRGIVALILEEATDTITKLKTDHKVGDDTAKAIENPFTIYTTDDIPPELSDDNKDYITKCLIGYTKTPYRVKVLLVEKNAENDTKADKFADALSVLATERWDYLAIPTITDAQCEAVATWVKTNRENKFKKVKAVLPNCAGDYEGIIDFGNTSIKTKTKTYSPAEYTARIAGLIAGTPMTISATYAPLAEVIDCDRHTLDENDEKVNKGEFFI